MICFLFISYLTELPALLKWNEVSILLKYFKTRIDSSRSEGESEREEKYRDMGMETVRERERE